MTNIAQTTASKAVVAFVAAAMLFTMFATPAKAQTSVEDLQAQITALMAQIAALSSGTPAAPAAPAAGSCAAIPAPLTIGAQNANVTALQNYLIAAGQSIPAGATGYFGTQTQSALAAWQAANGVTPAVGYYGPVTAAAMAAKCVPATTPTEPEDEDEDDSASVTLRGEAVLNDATLDSADEDDIEEGASDAVVAEFTVEFEDGDASISRLDVKFNSGDSSDAWDVLDSVSLWVDGNMVAEMDANDEDDFQNDEMTLRFSGLDIVALEDEEVEILIGVSLQNNIDGDDQDTYTVSVESMRFIDADGVVDTLGEDDITNGDTATFNVVEAGFEDEILVKTSSADPDAATIQVEDNSKSGFETVFVFDIDTDDSKNDIEINTVDIALTLSHAYNVIVDDAELVIDGVTVDDFDVSSAASLTPTLTFDVDGDVTVDAGDRVSATLKLRFRALANEGSTVQASISGAGAIEGEGADDVDSTGAATGEVHTLRSTGINVALDDASAAVTVADGNTNDYATYTLELEVTAFEQDVFLSTNPASSTAWSLVDGAGAAVTAGTSTVVMTSTGDEVTGFFEIKEGETETITIKVTYVPGVTNTAARLQLEELIYNEVASLVSTDTWEALPLTTYRTGVVTIVN